VSELTPAVSDQAKEAELRSLMQPIVTAAKQLGVRDDAAVKILREVFEADAGEEK
jgi:hypothetical protein